LFRSLPNRVERNISGGKQPFSMKRTPLVLFAAGIILTAFLITVSFEDERRDRQVIDHEENINRAQQYSEEQEVCTDEYKELVSPDGEVTYGASDGCEIFFLEERGWRPPGEEAPNK